MSRCFPFPPPGYDKKARIEDTDLLTKKKHKEKRQKKDKKDKEKREGSREKKNKDKERSKEKNSDKKDRKEKHKDKKDRDKDKDKSRTSDAKRIEGQAEFNNGDKLGPKSLQSNEISDSKYVQDLARRIRDDHKATGSQLGQKITVTDTRSGEFPGRMVERSIDNRLEEKEKANDRKEDDKQVNGQRNHVEVCSFRNEIVPGFPGVDQKRFQGITKPVEKNGIQKKVEEKEKTKQKESYNKDSKHKDRDREKKSKSKDENRDKEKKKEEKVKEVSETSKGQIKLKESSPKLKDSSLKLNHSSPKLKDSSKDFLNSCNTEILDVLKTSGKNLAVYGNLGKRKKLEINGISRGNGIWPSKLPRPVSSSHQVMENGRKLELSHRDVSFESDWQGGVHNLKVDIKEHKINGLMEVPKPIVNSSGPLSTKVRSSGNGEAFVKPPHPDSKYLNQILSVPKLEDCSDDLVDQEWLFSSDYVQSKKPKLNAPEVDGTQVWAEVLRIEFADLTALPYVIPF